MYDIQSKKFRVDEISSVIETLDVATANVDRDLLIASMIVYTLWLSDNEITKDPARLKAAAASVAEHIVFVVGSPTKQKGTIYN